MSLTPADFLPPAPHRRTLKNGLTVLFRPDHAAGLVSAQVWVKTGSVHEGDLLGSGISHYLEHMVFKGTAKYGCRELTQAVQRVGGNLNAYTTFDRTVYHVDGPADGLEISLDVLAELTLAAKIEPEETERERQVILREIAMRDDEPDSLLAEGVLAEAFRAHPYRFPVIGEKAIFEKVTRDELFAYYKSRYAPNNMALIVAGAAEPEAVFALAERYFGVHPARAVPPALVPSEPPQLAPRSITIRSDVRILRGVMTWRVPGLAHADAPALDVLAHVLGHGESSRFHRHLHADQGLVHQIDASVWNPGDTGLFWVSYCADTGKRTEVEAGIRAEIQKLVAEGVPAERLEKARRRTLVGLVNARKTVSGQAGRLGAEWVVLGDLGYAKIYLERLDRLTPEAVREAAVKYLVDAQCTAATLEPEEKETAATISSKQGQPGDFETHTLPNGVRVLLQPFAGFPKVHYRAVSVGGCRYEKPDARGSSALLSTLLCRDTKARDAEAVAEAVEGAGGSLVDLAGNNTLGISLEMLAGDRTLAEDVLAEAMLRPTFDKKTVKTEREAQVAAIKDDEDDVVEWARNAVRLAFFGDHPVAIDHMGLEKHLEKMPAETLRSLHEKLVVPANLVLAVSGAFDRDTVLASLTEKFGKLAGAPLAPVKIPFGTPAKTGRVVEKRDCEQAVVHLAFPDCGLVHDDHLAGELLDELMSGMASKLFLSVREERGMAYFVAAARTSFPDTGMFALYAGTAPEQAEAVLHEMRLEVDRMRRGAFDAGEIEAAKTRLRAGRRSGRQTIGARANAAALNAAFGLPVNYEPVWESKLAALTADDLAAFANRYLREDAALEHLVLPE